MNPLKVSAQFAAYVWYTEVRQGMRNHDEALRFAEQNWATFLPSAQEGWGKLLMRVTKPGGLKAVGCATIRHSGRRRNGSYGRRLLGGRAWLHGVHHLLGHRETSAQTNASTDPTAIPTTRNGRRYIRREPAC